MAGKLPISDELFKTLKALLEKLNANYVSAGFDLENLELIITLRIKEDEG